MHCSHPSSADFLPSFPQPGRLFELTENRPRYPRSIAAGFVKLGGGNLLKGLLLGGGYPVVQLGARWVHDASASRRAVVPANLSSSLHQHRPLSSRPVSLRVCAFVSVRACRPDGQGPRPEQQAQVCRLRLHLAALCPRERRAGAPGAPTSHAAWAGQTPVHRPRLLGERSGSESRREDSAHHVKALTDFFAFPPTARPRARACEDRVERARGVDDGAVGGSERCARAPAHAGGRGDRCDGGAPPGLADGGCEAPCALLQGGDHWSGPRGGVPSVHPAARRHSAGEEANLRAQASAKQPTAAPSVCHLLFIANCLLRQQLRLSGSPIRVAAVSLVSAHLPSNCRLFCFCFFHCSSGTGGPTLQGIPGGPR